MKTNLFTDRRFLNQKTYHSTAVVVGILEEDEFVKINNHG
jgi:hypothetical protein